MGAQTKDGSHLAGYGLFFSQCSAGIGADRAGLRLPFVNIRYLLKKALGFNGVSASQEGSVSSTDPLHKCLITLRQMGLVVPGELGVLEGGALFSGLLVPYN